MSELAKQAAELKRVRAAFRQLQNIAEYIGGINDERDCVPVLLEMRRIINGVCRALEGK